MDTTTERKLTAKEAADALGVAEACARRWILLRKISCFHQGRLVRISESEIQRMLDESFVPAWELNR